MKVRHFVMALSIALIAVCIGAPGLAQTTFGSILGTVTDPSGAVMPNVTVTVTNQGENTSREVFSDAQGNYQAENLKAGLYTITARVAGFREVTIKDIVVTARQTVRTDLKLVMGTAAEQVTVEARPELINTESQTISASFGSTEVLDLPANYRGAGSTSPYALLAYLPGVQADTGGAISVQGAQPFQVEYTVDGISTVSIRYNGPQREMFPSAEGISEMKVQGGGDSAEYGQVGDITTTSKAGTNVLHGSVFEYFQNRALDATAFGETLGKPAKSANTFGGSVGGPLFKNRTFFFVDYEAMRYRTGKTIHDTVPTQAMRDGNFTGVADVHDFDGTPFANDTIPADRINRVAPIILKYYPLPNQGDLNELHFHNHAALAPKPIISDQFDVRIDHTINSKQNIFGRWSYKRSDETVPSVLALPVGTDFKRQHQVTLAYNYAITNNLVNELRGGITRANNDGKFPLDGPALMQDLALNGLGPFPAGGFPNLNPGYFDGLISPIYHGRPSPNINSNFQINENLTWTKGRHTMKFGFDWRKLRLTAGWYSTTGDDYGDFWFSGQYSGYDFADFLMGVPYYSYVTHTAPLIDGRTNHYYAYAEDTFKVTPKLTLNFGVRFTRMPPFDDPVNHTNFDPSVPITGRVVISSDPRSMAATQPLFLQNINGCPLNLGPIDGVPCTPFLTAKAAGWPEGLRETYSHFSPRFGFAYRPFAGNGTVVRGGIGVYSVTTLGTVFYSIAGIHDGFQASYSNTGGDGDPPGFQFPNVQIGNPLDIAVGTQRFETSNQFNKKDPYTIQWNLTAERTLHGNTALRMSYIGSRGVQLTWAPDINQPLPLTANPNGTGPQSYSDRPRTDRPFPNWSFIYSRASGATSWYNAMQAELIHKYSNGLTFQSTWTWAHNLADNASFPGSFFGGEEGDGASLNRFNRHADWGNVGASRRHRWVTTLLYELPVGKGKYVLGNANRVVNGIIGGWQLSSIFLLQTGPYLTAWVPGDSSGTGTQARRTGGQRPSAVGNGNISNPTTDHYWDNSAFTCPGGGPPATPAAPLGCTDALGVFGNSTAGNLIGPGTVNLNLGLAKRFRLTERVSLRFESSFTNILNHPNLDDPETNVGSSSFGVVSQARPDSGSRVGQFSVRVEF